MPLDADPESPPPPPQAASRVTLRPTANHLRPIQDKDRFIAVLLEVDGAKPMEAARLQ
jgi:hypothetical protein